ncbi:hypothetical protein L6164_036464 [Bauhinia variegata]|uniref:Uncharacterized protein n=1 Tax=Bauhinia variegata TaxID=167791 RepID=A0ACB9KH15_BAUVA|nr:hypothetical protein L6164_036464 [Bauhinia variegata]
MALETISFSVLLIQTLMCSLFSLFMAAGGTETDIYCLRSIKKSLEDPNGYLSSWNFDNNTEGFICKFTGVNCWHDDENRVLYLNLTNMGLKGQFPRGIQNCTSLSGLYLRRNQLSGPIPSDISKLLPFVTSLDLSSNRFSGEIPTGIANCTYLNVLRLDNNQLSGKIPQSIALMNRLKESSFANNGGLCGAPLAPCMHKTLYNSFKEGAIIGYSFSVTSFIVIYLSYCVPWALIIKKRKKNRPKKVKQMVANQICQSLAENYTQRESQEIFKLLERFSSRMSLVELYNATECFGMDNDIGIGKMGMTYKATLPNGWFLAVKRLYDPDLFKRQFVLEIMILGRYRHRNMLPLLGFCIEKEERLLAYQYMSNGSLSHWLQPLESEAIRLEWPVRVKIALGIARGLSWLHHELYIVHLRLCSECILLDQNFDPKISNFGDAKFMSPNLDDDFDLSFEVNNGSDEVGIEKKDVYDFGSVIFELITGKKFGQVTDFLIGTDQSSSLLGFYESIDDSLIGKGFDNEIFTLLKIASDCVEGVLEERPTMLEVYNKMSAIWERHELMESSKSDMSKH